MKEERKAHKKSQKFDPFEPIDLSIMGTEDDCFGKLHSLTADECKRCGDSELCSIVVAQRMNITRKKLEKKTQFKDIEELPKEKNTQLAVLEFIKTKAKKGLSKKKVIRLAKKNFPEENKGKIIRLSKKYCNA